MGRSVITIEDEPPKEKEKEKSAKRSKTVTLCAETKSIEIHQTGRNDWTENAVVFKTMIDIVRECEYSFRKAAVIINKRLFPVAIVKEISHSTIQNWFEKRELKPKYMKYLNASSGLGREETGRNSIFAQYPAVQHEICRMLATQRKAGVPLNSRICRELIYGYLDFIKFPALDKYGGEFTVSRRWTRKFMGEVCLCSYRKSTKAAQHLPLDYTKQKQLMLEKIAILVEKYKIDKRFIVNTDQTGVSLVPVSAYSYDVTGSTDVAVLGKGEKRQITAVMAVSASGEVLAIQLIYSGKPGKTGALPDDEFTDPLTTNGFIFDQTESHWSNCDTHIRYINQIIVKYFRAKCKELKRDYEDSHFILIVDCWHAKKEFLQFMETVHPNIHLVFIPGGCTGELQPCDLFIQRPFKHAYLQQFSNWAAQSIVHSLANKTKPEDIRLDLKMKTIRNMSCRWILEAWKKVKGMTNYIETGWEKSGITQVIKNTRFTLEASLKWMEMKYDLHAVFVPMKKTREPPLLNSTTEKKIEELDEESDCSSEASQETSVFTEYGEDEEQTTEQVMEECLSDELIAECMQADFDNGE